MKMSKEWNASSSDAEEGLGVFLVLFYEFFLLIFTSLRQQFLDQIDTILLGNVVRSILIFWRM